MSPVRLDRIFQPHASSCEKLSKITPDLRDSISSDFPELLLIDFLMSYCITARCDEQEQRGSCRAHDKWDKWQSLSGERAGPNAADPWPSPSWLPCSPALIPLSIYGKVTRFFTKLFSVLVYLPWDCISNVCVKKQWCVDWECFNQFKMTMYPLVIKWLQCESSVVSCTVVQGSREKILKTAVKVLPKKLISRF